MSTTFQPAWWCRGPHRQTLWASVFRRPAAIALTRERLELPDGDFLDIDWTRATGDPIVLVLHGLEGSSNSNYAGGLLTALAARGWRAGLMHFRGCSGEPNRLARGYHSGETGDLAHVVAHLRARDPGVPMAIVGFSLGGNVLLKWLGEARGRAPIAAAVAVSVPFMLARAADRLEIGFSRLYQWHLLRSLRRSVRAKQRSVDLPLRRDPATLHTFREFDEHVTARLHGFRGAEHYYAESSSRRYLRHIRVPTLLLHARDDPFLYPDAIPRADEISPNVELELHEHGGHVGFVSGRWPWRASYWLEQRIPAFLDMQLRSHVTTRRNAD